MSDSNNDDIPVLHGDGIHDDTPAIQALFDGKPCRDAREGRDVLAVYSFGPRPLTDSDDEGGG